MISGHIRNKNDDEDIIKQENNALNDHSVLLQ